MQVIQAAHVGHMGVTHAFHAEFNERIVTRFDSCLLGSEYSTIYTFLFGTLSKYESPGTLQIVLKEAPPSMETCHKQKSSPSKNTYPYRNDMTTEEKLDVSRAIVAVDRWNFSAHFPRTPPSPDLGRHIYFDAGGGGGAGS